MTTDWFSIAPLLLVGFGGLALMVVDSFNAEKSELATLSAIVLGSAAVLSGVLAYTGTHAHATAPIAPYLATDGLAQLFNLTICAGGALSVLLAGGYLREHQLERGEFYAILLFSAFGAMVLASATDLLSVFIGL